MALAAGLAAWLSLAAADDGLRTLNAAAGGTACVLLAAALVLRLSLPVAPAVALLGLEYALLLVVEGGPLDTRAAFVAAGLFAVAELAYYSLELRDAVADEPGTHLRRLALVSGLAAAVVALGLGLLALVEVAGRSGSALQLVGAAAAVAALALLARAAREERPTDERL